MNIGSNIEVIGGKYAARLAGKTGEVDKMLPSGGVVANFKTKSADSDDVTVHGFILSQDSLREVTQ